MIRVLLADDHSIITDGISTLLKTDADISIVSVCHNGKEVIKHLEYLQVDLLLLDINMPEMDGLECAKILLKNNPDQKIAMLTMHNEKTLIESCINLGVKGYFLKTIAKDELVFAIKKIASGGEYFPADVTKAILQKQELKPVKNQSPLLGELSKREVEIIELIAQGLSNKEIATQLFISHRTADTHRTNLMRKLDIHNVAGLVRFAFENGLAN